MRFTITAFSSILAAATAVSGLTVEEARDLRPRLDEYLNGLSSRDLEKRNFCTDHYRDCQECFDKYSFCFVNNIPSTINWYVSFIPEKVLHVLMVAHSLATCSSCPGNC